MYNKSISKIYLTTFLCLAWLPYALSAEVNQSLSCDHIEMVIDSIFENELEQTDDTRSVTPILYESATNQKCESLAKILTLAGIIFYNDEKYNKARLVLEQADSIFQKNEIHSNIYVFTKLYRGLIEMIEGNSSNAIYLFQSANEFSKELKFYSGQMQSLINQGLVHIKAGKYPLARQYLNEASQLIEKSESKAITGYVFLNLGRSYLLEGNYPDAAINFEKAEFIWNQLSFNQGLYFVQTNYADIERRKGNLSRYEGHLLKALEVMEKDSVITRSTTYIELGHFYAAQNMEDKAINYLQKGIEISDGTNENEFLKLATELINIYGKRNNQNKIREVIQRLKEIYQTKLNRVSNQQTKWQKKEFVLESKIIENEKLRKAQKEAAYKVRIRNILLLFLSGILLTLFFLIRSWMRARKFLEQLKIEQIQSKISKDLHDDVGTVLAGISFQAQVLEARVNDENKEFARMISQKSNDVITKMRDMVWAINSKTNSPIDLEYKMKDYVTSMLVNSRFKCNIENTISTSPKGLSSDVKHCTYLIFKESLYNILKHSDGDKIDVSLSFDENKLEMQIHDNGPQQEMKKSGLGIRNMLDRATQIGATYKFYFDNGYNTFLSVPL